MPKGKTPISDRVTVRLGAQAKTLERMAKKSGQRESELVRTALDFFFAAHPTAEAVIAAVLDARAKEAAR